MWPDSVVRLEQHLGLGKAVENLAVKQFVVSCLLVREHRNKMLLEPAGMNTLTGVQARGGEAGSGARGISVADYLTTSSASTIRHPGIRRWSISTLWSSNGRCR